MLLTNQSHFASERLRISVRFPNRFCRSSGLSDVLRVAIFDRCVHYRWPTLIAAQRSVTSKRRRRPTAGKPATARPHTLYGSQTGAGARHRGYTERLRIGASKPPHRRSARAIHPAGELSEARSQTFKRKSPLHTSLKSLINKTFSFAAFHFIWIMHPTSK